MMILALVFILFLGCFEVRAITWSGQCVIDNPSRLLDHLHQMGKTNTPQVCMDYCASNAYAFAGVQFSHECLCGQTSPPTSVLRQDGECNRNCPGDITKFCGAVWRMNVYETTPSKPTTTTKNFLCHHWTAEQSAIIQSWIQNSVYSPDKEKALCEDYGPGYVFTQGNEAQAPGCGGCWCCKVVEDRISSAGIKESFSQYKYCRSDFIYTRYGEWKSSKSASIGIPWKCVYEVPKSVYSCIKTHGTHFFEVIKCLEESISSECRQYICHYLGKVNPAAKVICTCIVADGLIGNALECRKQNSASWIGTIECIIAKTPVNCISSLCGILKKVFPEIPEIGPICTCGAEIVVAVDKCHMELKSDWEKIAKCTVEAAAKDCEQYVCKFAGKIFPPIMDTKLCKPKPLWKFFLY